MITAIKRPHVKLHWIRGPKTQTDDGGYIIPYYAEECSEMQIMSVKYAVPHANGQGVWYASKYIGIYPDGAYKQFHLLVNAKYELEEWYQFIKEADHAESV